MQAAEMVRQRREGRSLIYSVDTGFRSDFSEMSELRFESCGRVADERIAGTPAVSERARESLPVSRAPADYCGW